MARTQTALDHRISGLTQQFGSALVDAVRAHLAIEVARLVGDRNGKLAVGDGSGRLRRGSVNAAVLGTLLQAVKSHPGLRSEQIYKKVSLTPKLAKAGLAKLRAQGKVKIRGKKRGATYRVA